METMMDHDEFPLIIPSASPWRFCGAARDATKLGPLFVLSNHDRAHQSVSQHTVTLEAQLTYANKDGSGTTLKELQ